MDVPEITLEGSQMGQFVNEMYKTAMTSESAAGLAWKYGDVLAGLELMMTAREYFRAIREMHGGD